MELTDTELTADAIHAYIEATRKRELAEAREQEKAAKAEREKLRQHFMELDVPPDAMNQVAKLVRRAVAAGDKQALVIQFPSDWLPDQGRAITNHAEDWHMHLDGFAKRAYAYYERELEPRGFQLRAEIISWPGGMPGDVGLFLQWKRAEEE